MNKITIKLLAHRYMKLAQDENVVQWAVDMLQEGYDSQSLAILAGLSFPYSWEEVEQYLHKTLAELGWAYPEKEQCLRLYARDVATSIVNGTISTADGCREMYRIARALDFPGDLAAWLYLDEGIDPEKRHEAVGEIFDADVREYAHRYIGR